MYFIISKGDMNNASCFQHRSAWELISSAANLSVRSLFLLATFCENALRKAKMVLSRSLQFFPRKCTCCPLCTSLCPPLCDFPGFRLLVCSTFSQPSDLPLAFTLTVRETATMTRTHSVTVATSSALCRMHDTGNCSALYSNSNCTHI